MLSQVKIRGFQSLYNVELDLEPFTVIVGPSSSGKSAFVRALKMLTSNSRGSTFISAGEKICTIQATTDAGTVVLKRGKATSDNEYVLVPSGDEAVQQTFTKLGGETPEEVSKFLGLDSKDAALHFASQLDKPYLLDDAPNSVARTLGSLTGVNIIFEGARESNRRKLTASSARKTRVEDLEGIKSRVESYRGLKEQLEAIAEAEDLITLARALDKRLERLVAYVDTLEIAEASIARTEAAANLEVPSMDEYEAAAERLGRFTELLSAVGKAGADIKKWATAVTEATEAEERTLAEYTTALQEAGTCPTCGQGTKELHAHV